MTYKLFIFDFDGTLADCGGDLRRLAADGIRLFPGVPQMIRALAGQGLRIAVVSTGSEAKVRAVLGPELSALVTQFACGPALFGRAEKLRSLARKLKIAPAEVLCVGDEACDLEAAAKAGFPAGAVCWGRAAAEALTCRGPKHLFKAPAELAALAA